MPIPISAWLAAACLALSAAAWIHGRSHGIDITEARYAAQATEADREARRIEQQRADRAQEAQDALIVDKRRTEAAAAAAGRELDRLRDALAKRGAAASDPDPARRGDGTRERELFGTCAAALADMGRDADRLANKLTALQSWVRGACVNPTFVRSR